MLAGRNAERGSPVGTLVEPGERGRPWREPDGREKRSRAGKDLMGGGCGRSLLRVMAGTSEGLWRGGVRW